ncbi:MAG: hypothetical protein Q8N00_01970 [Nitrospirota bacterium]|nr:hypothetical protein [Nitrospirota bacterium]MDP3598891.1 hypothetical protein [Nitrospirota bacterium]
MGLLLQREARRHLQLFFMLELSFHGQLHVIEQEEPTYKLWTQIAKTYLVLEDDLPTDQEKRS